ncbi:Ribosomal RNA processing protein 1-like protein [Camponotus floridanus]|uniref:Ribosomal RNA processing protein 1-like protein n=1 Tax=Camponotus floridanus TaxID=104421 RepID=E2A2G3_CAMFO|nr:Ribosomal RNA processing protein 1-like protein [Camponotus floridanus]
MQLISAKSESKKNLFIVQEIKIARLLANNDKRIRDKALKRLKKWLTVRSQSSFAFTKTDFMSLWKGLFYCMWMSDKMLIQEELAESLSKLVHCFDSKDTILLYTSCALKTLAMEWFGIDQYRLDKFLMLVRRILRQTFVTCKDKSWDIKWVTELSQMFLELFLYPKTTLGFNLHMTEIYLEELAKVSNGNISESVVHEFIKPFIIYLMTTDDERQMKHIMQHIFRYLINQSDIGLDYMDKFKAWQRAGFPCAHVDDMQKIEIDTEENIDIKSGHLLESEIQNKSEKPLDPRAGRVDVQLPQIPFNAAEIVKMLSVHQFHPSSKTKSRRQLSRLLEEFRELSEGRMPLGIKKVKKLNLQKHDSKKESRKAALHLIQFEKKLFSDNINKKQKRKRNGEIIANTFSDHLKNRDQLELNSIIDTIDSKSDSINSTANMKANLQDTDADIIPIKKQKRNNGKTTVSSTYSSNNLKNRDYLELNSIVDTIDSKSDSIDSTANMKINLQDTDADILPTKKQKKKNEEAIVSSISSSNNLKNRDHLELNSIRDTINSKSDSIDSIANMKTNLQDADADILSPKKQGRKRNTNIVSSKKEKCNLTYNKFDDKRVIEDKRKLKTKVHRKFNKTKKIKLSQTDDTFITDNNLKCKPKKTELHEKHTFNKEQYIFTSPVLKKKNLLRKATKNKKSLVLKKTIFEKNVTHNNEGTLKDELSNQTKKQINLNNSLEKKKVVFGLSRNTEQHTSEYFQQVRKSPAIPFDANKKPLASVLKTSAISSPLNPFYKKK